MKTLNNIKADTDVKLRAQQIAKDLGIPLSTIINAFLKEFIRNKSICFTTAPRMTNEFEQILKNIEEDIKNQKNLSPAFKKEKEVIAHLDGFSDIPLK